MSQRGLAADVARLGDLAFRGDKLLSDRTSYLSYGFGADASHTKSRGKQSRYHRAGNRTSCV